MTSFDYTIYFSYLVVKILNCEFLGGSVGGLHKSMTRLSSSGQINSTNSGGNAAPPLATTQTQNIPVAPPLSSSVTVSNANKWGISPSIGPTRVSSGGVTVTTISPKSARPLSQSPLSVGSVTVRNKVPV